MRRSIPNGLVRWRHGLARDDLRAGTKFGMGVILEIRGGAEAGKLIPLRGGQSVTIGRAKGRAEVALPQDTFMSGVHFAVECGPRGCRVQDRKSSNGTFLNGAKIQDAMLANGDEIKAGQTVFIVKIVPDAKIAEMAPPEETAPPKATSSGIRRASRPGEVSRSGIRKALSDSKAEARKPAPAAPPTPEARDLLASGEKQTEKDGEADSGGAPRAPAPPRPPESEGDLWSSASSFGQPARNEPAKRELPPSETPGMIAGPPVGALPSIRPIPRPSAEAPKPRASDSQIGVQPATRKPVERAAAFCVMGWSFPAAPADWQIQEGFGLQQSGHEEFPGSVAASEELLGGITLQQFVESQISTLRGYLRDPKIEPTMPPRVGGADESMAVDVRHSTKDGRELVYRRIYARSGSSVGVLTVTTLAAEFPQVLQSLQSLLEGAAFRSTVAR